MILILLKNSDGLLNNNGWGIATTITGLTAGFYKGNWDVLLSALSTNTNNNILATPSIVTLDNMEAEFNVGQEVPVLISTQTTTTDKVYNSISRQSIGVMLKVKPQIIKVIRFYLKSGKRCRVSLIVLLLIHII